MDITNSQDTMEITGDPPTAEQGNSGIVKPHDHDVLSGRGNFVNHHAGNENFRKLVKFHKKAYVACPKAQKAIYSKIIYDEIRALTPPGRFLKQDPKTKQWSAIGEKKALDKTRQALREGAPELLKELETGPDGSAAPGTSQQNNGGGGGAEDFVAQLQKLQGHGARHPGAAGALMGSPLAMSFPNPNNPFAAFAAPGPGSILAAAAQLQAAQQKPAPSTQNQLEAQLQLLKMQMSTQQLANLAAAQQGAMGRTNQNAGFAAMTAQGGAGAQPPGSISLPAGGGNDMTAVLAAMMNMPGANPAAVLAYQQQLAQVALFNQMNAMSMAGGADGVPNMQNMQQMQNNMHAMQTMQNLQNAQNAGGAGTPKPDQPQSKCPSDSSLNTLASDKGNGHKRLRGSGGGGGPDGGFNSSFTRAQRIGLKNSLTTGRRPNRHMINADVHNSLNSTLKNSLMSIESLTLDDIDSSGFDGGVKMEGVFEDSDTVM